MYWWYLSLGFKAFQLFMSQFWIERFSIIVFLYCTINCLWCELVEVGFNWGLWALYQATRGAPLSCRPKSLKWSVRSSDGRCCTGHHNKEIQRISLCLLCLIYHFQIIVWVKMSRDVDQLAIRLARVLLFVLKLIQTRRTGLHHTILMYKCVQSWTDPWW